MTATTSASRVLPPLLVVALVLTPTGVAGQTPPDPQDFAVPVVRLPFPQEDGTLTPYTFELGYPLMTLIYDTLFWRDREGTPQPWLARAVETSADGRELTLHIHEGVRWHDGRQVTADDVVFTFGFVGSRRHARFTPELKAVQDVRAVDPATVVIRLRHPAPGFFDQPLADLPILPAHLWRDLPPARAAPEGLPVGSGPYRLVEHQPGVRYRFEANSGYFRGEPAVAALEVPIIRRVDETIKAFRHRQIDMIPVSLPEQAVGHVEGLGTRLAKGPSYLGTVLAFNVRQPPFDRIDNRRAVAGALDLRRIAGAVGEAVAADHGYLHPASMWSPQEVLHTYDGASPVRLDALGIPPFTVLAPENDPVKVEAARQVTLALVRAGLNVTSRAVPVEELKSALGRDGSPPTFEAAIDVIPPLASYDPDFLRRLFALDATDGLNLSGYRDPEFSQLTEMIATTPDPPVRRAAVAQALRRLATDIPAVPLFFSNGVYAYRPAVYDRWVFVKGAGILDKRSFVEPLPAPTRPTPPALERATGADLPLGRAALALLAVAGVLAGVILVRR